MTILWTDDQDKPTPAMPKPSVVLGVWLESGEGIWMAQRLERLVKVPNHQDPVPCRCQARILEVEALAAGVRQWENEDIFTFLERVYSIPRSVMRRALQANDWLDPDDDLRIGRDTASLWDMRPEEIDALRELGPKYLHRVIAVYEAAGL